MVRLSLRPARQRRSHAGTPLHEPPGAIVRDVASQAQGAVERQRRRVDRATVDVTESLIRGRHGIAYVVVALGLFGVLFALVRKQRTAAADVAITMRVQRQRKPWVRRTMAVVSWPGFPPQSRLIPPVLASVMWVFGLRLEAVFQFAAWGTTGISYVVKKFMRRPRPNHPEIRVAIANLGGSSFPSGHVLGYVGVYGFLAFLAGTLIRPRALRRLVVAGFAALIALVGPSRIYLGHHWFTDVLASYLLGTSYLLGLTALYRRIKARRAGLA